MRGRGGLRHGRDGAAGVEFALWLSVLTIPILNVIDIGLYVHRRMQVEEAAQVAAQMIWETCDTRAKLPATDATRCPLLTAPTNRILAAAQSTSLGAAVQLRNPDEPDAPIQRVGVTEGYFCITPSGDRQQVAAPPAARPADCTSVGGAATTVPGDYVTVTVSYPYAPLFNGVSLGGMLTTPIVRTSTMRLD
ncbi:TadE family protein [Brevundimonas naejangsanensis]|nr:TadE family protein [Brevundimonas naejangsanensis]